VPAGGKPTVCFYWRSKPRRFSLDPPPPGTAGIAVVTLPAEEFEQRLQVVRRLISGRTNRRSRWRQYCSRDRAERSYYMEMDTGWHSLRRPPEGVQAVVQVEDDDALLPAAPSLSGKPMLPVLPVAPFILALTDVTPHS
jgi:hypothetical protein